MQKNAALFFGSFNPIHIGHLIIASHFINYSATDEVWFVVSPQNPFKAQATLLENHHRLMMAKLATEDNPAFKVSDIEFKMPTPSYTVDTLAYLYEKYPKRNFALIMGADNLLHFDKWKNYETILKHHKILVYPRPGIEIPQLIKHPNIEMVDAPMIQISSSFIRQAIAENKNVKYILPERVRIYIDEMNFYKK